MVPLHQVVGSATTALVVGREEIYIFPMTVGRTIFPIRNPSGLRPACWHLDDIGPKPVFFTALFLFFFMFFHLFYLVFLFSFSGEATEVLADKFGWYYLAIGVLKTRVTNLKFDGRAHIRT